MTDYVAKIESILYDPTKFIVLGPVDTCDNTIRIESRLLQLKKKGYIPTVLYDTKRPVGSQRPRMYGLPKLHNKEVPLCPILSVTGSSRHQLAKWLIHII